MNWIPIKSFENYSISEKGDIKSSFNKEKIIYLKPWVNSNKKNDYIRISLFKNKKQYKFLLHRLIAIHFIPNPQKKPQVNHIDGNRQNNNIENLEWVTNSENQLHSFHVTKTWKHNNPMKGRFGKDHNKSKKFVIEFPNGEKKEYSGEYEMVRDIGFGRSLISWARINRNSGYKFIKGKMKGLKVHF